MVWFFRALVFSIATMLFSTTISYADEVSPQSTTAANAAEQPYEQVGQPIEDDNQTLTLNSDEFGGMGPISLTGSYSDTFGYIVTAKYNQLINQWNALSLLADAGEEENRFDATFATQFAKHNRVKLSLERLEQKLDFDYDSGDTEQWVPQYSTGLGYQYLFANPVWVSDLEFSGYYAKADSEDLSTVRYDDNGTLYDNYRHIAGATSEGLAATLDFLPWQHSVLGAGLNFDKVFYDNKYSDVDADDRSGLGFTLSLEQLLSRHFKAKLLASQRETYDAYQAQLSWLLKTTAASSVELNLSGERDIGEDSSPNDSRVDVELAYYFDSQHYASGYSMKTQGDASSLLAWSDKSLAYMDMVLAAADQKDVIVTNAVSNPNSETLLSSDESDTISLNAGVVNTIDLAPYIKKANITDLQNKKVRVFGGPTDVSFTYNTQSEQLVTTDVVPVADAGKKINPLVVLFVDDDTDTSLKDKIANHDIAKLLFNMRVIIDTNQPYPNSGFTNERDAYAGEAFNETYYLEYLDSVNGDDFDTLFVNPDTTYTLLYIDSDHPGSYVKKGGTGLSYSINTNKQTITFSGTLADDFDGATITIMACNDAECASAPQTIDLVPAGLRIGGGALDDVLAGDSYDYTLSSSQASPGNDGETFDEDNTYAKFYFDGSEVTDTNLELTFSDDDTQLTLTTDGDPIPTKYAENPAKNIEAVIYGQNSIGETANNADDPFTILVTATEPTVSGGTLADATTSDTYDSGELVGNEVEIGTGTISTASVSYQDESGNSVSASELGIDVDYTEGGSSLKLTSSDVDPNVAYVGQTMKAKIRVTNSAGYEGKNGFTNSPLYITVHGEAPSFTAGTLATATSGSSYDSGDLVGSEVDLGSGTITSASVSYKDESGNTVSASTLGIDVDYTEGGSSLKLTSTNVDPSEAYEGQDMDVILTVTNSAGETSTSTVSIVLPIAGSTVTLACPAAADIDDTSNSSTVTSSDSGGTSHSFDVSKIQTPDGNLGFYKAKLSSSGGGYTLTCEYASDVDLHIVPPYDYEAVISSTLPSDTTTSGSHWSGNTCTFSSSNSESKCEVTFTE